MKRFLLFIVLGLIACADDHQNKKEDEKQIGKWSIINRNVIDPNGTWFRFVGANIASCASHECLNEEIPILKSFGFNSIRLWAVGHNQSSWPTDPSAHGELVRAKIDWLASEGFKIILTLSDSLNSIEGMNKAGNGSNNRWYQTGWEDYTKKHIEQIMRWVGDNKNVAVIQAHNEGGHSWLADPWLYLDWCKKIQKIVRLHNRVSLFSCGLHDLHHAVQDPNLYEKYLTELTKIDDRYIMTYSFYNNNNLTFSTFDMAKKLNIPALVTENGCCCSTRGQCDCNNGRAVFENRDWGPRALINRWGVAGVLAWELENRHPNCTFTGHSAPELNTGDLWKSFAMEVSR